jgi:hypothetical protein
MSHCLPSSCTFFSLRHASRKLRGLQNTLMRYLLDNLKGRPASKKGRETAICVKYIQYAGIPFYPNMIPGTSKRRSTNGTAGFWNNILHVNF